MLVVAFLSIRKKKCMSAVTDTKQNCVETRRQAPLFSCSSVTHEYQNFNTCWSNVRCVNTISVTPLTKQYNMKSSLCWGAADKSQTRPPSSSDVQRYHVALLHLWAILFYISRWDFGHIKSWNTLSAPGSDHFNMLTCTWTRQHHLLWCRLMGSHWSLRFEQPVCVCVFHVQKS